MRLGGGDTSSSHADPFARSSPSPAKLLSLAARTWTRRCGCSCLNPTFPFPATPSQKYESVSATAVSSRFDAGISSGVSVSTKVHPASPVHPSQVSYPSDGEARGENGRLPVVYKNILSMLHAGKIFPSIHIRMKTRSCVPTGSTVMAVRPPHVYKSSSPTVPSPSP